MKRFLFILLTVCINVPLYAQTEAVPDTLTRTDGYIPPTGEQYFSDETRNIDGYLIDMNSLIKTPAPDLSNYKLVIPDASKDYSRIFRLNPDITYSSGLSRMFSLSGSPYYSANPFGLTGFGSGNTMDHLQMGSFRLKNGWRLNTYGEYDKDGWRVPNPSALPWQRNNFKGAFELKSQDGSFGIRIEVQRGRENPF